MSTIVFKGTRSSRSNASIYRWVRRALTLASLFGDTAFAGALEKTETRLAGVVEPMIGQPFLRNDEPSFFAATLPLNGAIYNA